MPLGTKQIKVLVIDDEKLQTKMIQRHLEAIGSYTVRIENEGARALTSAFEFAPDVILLDIVMPQVDGHSITQQLKAEPQTAHTPIIFISALARKTDTIGTLSQIKDSYFLAKPFLRNDLIHAIETVTSGKN